MDDNRLRNNYENHEGNDTQGLFINKRVLSLALACIIFFCFFVFIAGYFLGQKNVAERFAHKIEQDSLADKISSSIYSLYDSKGADSDALDASETSESMDLPEEALDAPITIPDYSTQEALAAGVDEQKEGSDTVSLLKEEPIKRYYAELIGFGSMKAADIFVQRLQKNGITLEINKRESKTTKGKTIAWYQVVTQKISKEELTNLVTRLKQEERLNGVRIIAC